MTPKEASRAEAEVNRARAERPKNPQATAGSPPPPSKRAKVKKPEPVVVKTGRVSYVDEFGDALPDFTPQAVLPAWVAIGFMLNKAGLDGFTESELEELSVVSAPVAQKWAGFFLPYMAEITLAGTLLWIMFPKVKKKVEREKAEAELELKKRPLSAPPVKPREASTVPAPPREEKKAPPSQPGGFPILEEARLAPDPKSK